ncbi:MAG: SPFH domain-containing protein, partial [Pseudomonadota bacterium]
LAVGDWSKYFHAAAQAALRSVLSAQTLETLLQDASAMEGPIRDLLATPSTEIGIAIDRVSVKDVILPGEMRTLMMTVLEAEKRAQAAAIRRREETAETRSMLNTAKVMENNPLLLRLKELETLERVTERIGNITVFGGLDDVMNKLVQIGSRKTSEEAP